LFTEQDDPEDENDVSGRQMWEVRERFKYLFAKSYCGKPLTLYIVVDQSGSITNDFDSVVLFVKELIHQVRS
jgi:hypothetical protein